MVLQINWPGAAPKVAGRSPSAFEEADGNHRRLRSSVSFTRPGVAGDLHDAGTLHSARSRTRCADHKRSATFAPPCLSGPFFANDEFSTYGRLSCAHRQRPTCGDEGPAMVQRIRNVVKVGRSWPGREDQIDHRIQHQTGHPQLPLAIEGAGNRTRWPPRVLLPRGTPATAMQCRAAIQWRSTRASPSPRRGRTFRIGDVKLRGSPSTIMTPRMLGRGRHQNGL